MAYFCAWLEEKKLQRDKNGKAKNLTEKEECRLTKYDFNKTDICNLFVSQSSTRENIPQVVTFCNHTIQNLKTRQTMTGQSVQTEVIS